MVRPMFPFAGLALLFGGALIGAIHNNHSTTSKVAPFTFAEVQKAVAEQQAAHMIFRLVPEEAAASVVTYEAWMKTDSPAIAVRTPEGRVLSDRAGVHHFGKGQQNFLLTKEPVTREFVQQEMLMPQFENDLNDTESIHWVASAIKSDTSTRTLVQFVSDEGGVHRVFWVDPNTHLPLRLDVEKYSTAASSSASPAPRAGKFHVIYNYDREAPSDIFAPTVKSE